MTPGGNDMHPVNVDAGESRSRIQKSTGLFTEVGKTIISPILPSRYQYKPGWQKFAGE